MTHDPLPHRYPFRFVERSPDGEALTVRLTPGDHWSRSGTGVLPGLLGVEMLAQASAVLLARSVGDEPSSLSKPGYLAGVVDFEAVRPLQPPEDLTLRSEIEKVFGRLLRVRAEGRDAEGELVLAGTLLLTTGGVG